MASVNGDSECSAVAVSGEQREKVVELHRATTVKVCGWVVGVSGREQGQKIIEIDTAASVDISDAIFRNIGDIREGEPVWLRGGFKEVQFNLSVRWGIG